MKETKYKCDLCNESLEEPQVVGICFYSYAIWTKNPEKAEQHLCQFCISALNDAMDRLMNFEKQGPNA